MELNASVALQTHQEYGNNLRAIEWRLLKTVGLLFLFKLMKQINMCGGHSIHVSNNVKVFKIQLPLRKPHKTKESRSKMKQGG
jgi:hypothetical protein